jgi:arginase
MLGGVQRSPVPGGKPLRVGLVYIDAHADFNTPETTLSGMLGGMDVAAAAGLCLTNLRRTSKQEQPLETGNIVLAGVRDTDQDGDITPVKAYFFLMHGIVFRFFTFENLVIY